MTVKTISAAEWEVLRLVHAGLRDKAIAYELGLTFRTVQTCCGRMYRKLGLKYPAQQRVIAALMYERCEVAPIHSRVPPRARVSPPADSSPPAGGQPFESIR